MYNICCISSNNYLKLLIPFLLSLFDNCNDSITNVYLGNIDIPDTTFLTDQYPKIKIIELSDHETRKKDHIYTQRVSHKTWMIQKLLEEGLEKLVMMDIDMIVIRDFLQTFEEIKEDIGLCRRNVVYTPGNFYIGSIFYISKNNDNTKKFVSKWIKKMTKMINDEGLRKAETPALNKIFKDFRKNICEIPESVYSHHRDIDRTKVGDGGKDKHVYVIHYKYKLKKEKILNYTGDPTQEMFDSYMKEYMKDYCKNIKKIVKRYL